VFNALYVTWTSAKYKFKSSRKIHEYKVDIFNMCAKLLQVSDICIETVEGIDYNCCVNELAL
jgi:hypothetical protein